MTDKTIVRESKFRHIFGGTSRKEVSTHNVRVHSSVHLIRASTKYWAVPWDTQGGALAVAPLDYAGKLPEGTKCKLLRANGQEITDFQWSPHDDSIIATGSRETTIRTFKIPEGGIVTRDEDVTEHLCELQGHKRRIWALSWHPAVENFLLSCSNDHTIKLWDLNTSQERISMEDKSSGVQSVSWSESGKLFCTTSKDKKLRVYDPRAQTTQLYEQVSHQNAKGFNATFIESDRIVSVGADKQSRLEVYLWDVRNGLQQPYKKCVYSPNPNILLPSYDFATGILFLQGRGRTVMSFEINTFEPFVHKLPSVDTTPYSYAAAIPKRGVDVKKGEITRFYSLTQAKSKEIGCTVECISIFAPRKQAATIFQEDIYPPVRAAEGAHDVDSWMSGVDKMPAVISLKPEDIPSIFVIPEEEGGKNREWEAVVLEERKAVPLEEDVLLTSVEKLKKDFPTPDLSSGTISVVKAEGNEERWLSVEDNEVHVLVNEDSASVDFTFKLESIKQITVDGSTFVVELENEAAKEYKLLAKDAGAAKIWKKSLEVHKQLALDPEYQEFKKTTDRLQTIEKSKNQLQPEALLLDAAYQRKAAKSPALMRRVKARSSTLSLTPESSPFMTGSSPSKSPALASDTFESWLEELAPSSNAANTVQWVKKWFLLEKTLLSVYKSNKATNSHPLDKFSLSKVIAVTACDSIGGREFCFKICTPGQVIHLSALTSDDRDNWLRYLCNAAPKIDTLVNVASSSFVAQAATEGFLSVKRGEETWERLWLTIMENNNQISLFYFKNNMSSEPLFRYDLEAITSVEVVPETTDFAINLNLDDLKQVLHRCKTDSDVQRWVAKLGFLQKQGQALYDLLGLSDTEVDKPDEQPKIITTIVEPVAVKNGEFPLLMRVQGRRRIRISMVETSATSLNCSTSVVLDCGKAIYQWNGAKAARVCKAAAADLANKIRTKERGGLAQMFVLNQGKNDDNKAFWNKLGDPNREVAIAEVEEEEGQSYVKLYRVLGILTKRAERIKLIHDSSRLPPCEYLDSKSCTVVDCGPEIYVWVGKRAQAYERHLSLYLATKMSKQEGRPAWTTVTRVPEKGETILFKQKFSNFPGMLPINMSRQVAVGRVAVVKDQEDIDVIQMHKAKPPAPIMYDDGSGIIKNIWLVDGKGKVEIAEEHWGRFYAGDSYIVHYQYNLPQKTKNFHLLYYWQGSESSRTEKGASAFITVTVNDELSDATQERVVQNSETLHFLKIFKGKYVVYQGDEEPDAAKKTNQLFMVTGCSADYCWPVELNVAPASLHYRHSVVVTTSDKAFVWRGAASNDFEHSCASSFAEKLGFSGDKIAQVTAKSEPADFWKALQSQGNNDYFGDNLDSSVSRAEPKFFGVSSASGTVIATPVFNFNQEDLEATHCAIVDSASLFPGVYVWFGYKCSEIEKQMSMEAAIDYVKQSKTHDPSTPVSVVEQFTETYDFIRLFRTWSKKKYPEKRRNLKPTQVPVDEVLCRYTTETYAYEDLMKDILPEGVDATKLESYLSDEEFEKIFSINRKEFLKLPLWKAEQMKRDANLF